MRTGLHRRARRGGEPQPGPRPEGGRGGALPGSSLQPRSLRGETHTGGASNADASWNFRNPPPPPLHGNKGPKLQTGQQAPEAERGCGDRARGLRDPNPVLSPLCPAPRNVAVRPLGEGGGEDNKIGIFVKCFPSHSNKESWTPTPRCNHGNNPQKAVLLKLGSSRHPSL